VKQTVEGAQASMEGMVENVKGTVGDTVEAVQRTFDLHHQMEQHPWLMLSGSLFVGYLLGSRGNGHTAAVGSASEAKFSPASPIPALPSESFTSPKPQQGTESGDLGWFTDEIAALKSAAVGAVVSTLRGMFKQALPSPTLPLTRSCSQIVDRVKLDWRPELVAIHKEANHRIMHEDRFGETNSFSC